MFCQKSAVRTNDTDSAGRCTIPLPMNTAFSPERATFEANTFEPRRVQESLKSYGCALIKRLLQPDRLAEFDARIACNLNGIDAALRRHGLDPSMGNGWPLYFAEDLDRELVQETFCQSAPGFFNPRRMGELPRRSLLDYVFPRLRDTGLDRVIRKGIGLWLRRLYTSAAICHIRNFPSVEPAQIQEAERGLEFHQDNKLYDVRHPILTLWFPFRYEHGKMASLEFLPRAEPEFLPTVTRCGIARDAFPKEAFWSPEYELGDAVLISGWAPHRTYYPPAISLERTSIDLRFFPTRVPEPLYA